jgi:hypothetical protein
MGELLMERQVGLLVMRDENDILQEYLTRIVNYYDTILVLDGSEDDEGRRICSLFPEVVFYAKDADVTEGAVNDSIRGILLEKAKEIAPHKRWVAALHPDEFPSGNPLEMLGMIDRQYPSADSVMIDNVQFFPHVSQREEWENRTVLEPILRWCLLPGWPEYRYFRMKPEFVYGDSHRQVIPPASMNSCIRVNGFFHKHITHRSLEQVKKRALTRIESGWQNVGYESMQELQDIFSESIEYPPGLMDHSYISKMF